MKVFVLVTETRYGIEVDVYAEKWKAETALRDWILDCITPLVLRESRTPTSSDIDEVLEDPDCSEFWRNDEDCWSLVEKEIQ